jgi:hypothetical protein
MILRGLFLLARGKTAGMAEFSPSMDAFTASLAPLIAFPLVGALVSATGGQWEFALVGFLSRLCSVLVLPVMVYEFARHTEREALWLRAATALNWSFWMMLPVLFIAAFLGAILVEAGLAMQEAEYAVLAVAGAYLLWYRWFIVSAGLGLGRWQAAGFVGVSSVAIAVFTAVPVWLVK